MKTMLKTRLLNLLIRVYRSMFPKQKKEASLQNYTASEFIEKYKNASESILTLSLYISDRDNKGEQIQSEILDECLHHLKSNIIESIGGLSVQYSEGFYKTLEGIIIKENIAIFSAYFFDAQTSFQSLENIFKIFFDLGKKTSQECLLVCLNQKAMLVYL